VGAYVVVVIDAPLEDEKPSVKLVEGFIESYSE